MREIDEDSTEPPNPADLVQQQELRAQIHEVVAQLPDREQSWLLMVVCEGMRYQEVAEVLNTFSSGFQIKMRSTSSKLIWSARRS